MITDLLHRPLTSLRVSVTDRCNLRCAYCMPEPDYVWIPRDELLSFEEITRLVGLFRDLGVRKLRLTGGEPLLRRDLPDLVARLAALAGIDDIALTTNAVLLPPCVGDLVAAGLKRVTISLDTLRRERFRELTRRDQLPDVLAGIAAARTAFRESAPGRLKFNAVIMRGVNDDELCELLEFAAAHGAEMRFIEYMDVGGATRWELQRVVSRADMLATIARRYGPITPLGENDRAPAERFALPDGRTFGIIASTTAPFCRDCDRARLTAEGTFYTCLYAPHGTELKPALRSGAPDADLRGKIAAIWQARRDRGAEARAATAERSIFVPVEALRRDSRLEMHTRGG